MKPKYSTVSICREKILRRIPLDELGIFARWREIARNYGCSELRFKMARLESPTYARADAGHEVGGGIRMRCAKCPLYSSWSNESDSGESCGIFGDGWDNRLQYEDASGNIVGCYVDHHFIKLVEREYEEHLQEEADSIEEWMLKEDLLWDQLEDGDAD